MPGSQMAARGATISKLFNRKSVVANRLQPKLIAYLFLLLLTGCFSNTATFDKDHAIESLGQPVKIEYYRHTGEQAFQFKETPAFIITGKKEMGDALQEIRLANNPEPWKGGGWDKIVITYPDTVLKLNTNKRKIGSAASGLFYDLDKSNFITKRLNE